MRTLPSTGCFFVSFQLWTSKKTKYVLPVRTESMWHSLLRSVLPQLCLEWQILVTLSAQPFLPELRAWASMQGVSSQGFAMVFCPGCLPFPSVWFTLNCELYWYFSWIVLVWLLSSVVLLRKGYGKVSTQASTESSSVATFWSFTASECTFFLFYCCW